MKISSRKYARALALMLDAADRVIIGNFLAVLRKRRQMKLLPKILAAFEEEWLAQRGYARVEVQYPKKFEASLADLEKKLKEKLGDKLSLRAIPREDLIGGYRVRIGDTLIDASVENSLQLLAHKISSM